MRGFAVTLVLFFLAGTQARHFWQQDAPPPSPVERFREHFQAYVDSARATAREMINQLDASSFGQRYNLDLSTKVEMLVAVYDQLRELLGPSFQVISDHLHTDFREMTQDLAPIRAKLKPLLDDLNTKLQSVGEAYYEKMKPVVEEWRHSVRQDLDQLQNKLEPLTAQAKEKVQALVADFRQKAAPHMEELRQAVRQKVQQLQERAVPRLQEFRTSMEQQISTLREASAPMLQGLHQQLGPAMKKLEEKLMSLLSTAQRGLEEHSQQQQS